MLLLSAHLGWAKVDETNTLSTFQTPALRAVQPVVTDVTPTYYELTLSRTHTFSNYGGTQRFSMVYNPNNSLYYITSGGSSYYKTSTVYEDGTLVSGTAGSNYDKRGMWYNPTTGNLEVQPYGASYLASVTIGSDSLVASEDKIADYVLDAGFTTSSLFTLDVDDYELIQYYGGVIKRFSRSDGSYLGQVVLDIPSGSTIASYSLAYTGMLHQEYAIYDRMNNRALLYSKASHALTQIVHFDEAISTWDYGFSFTNGIFFFTTQAGTAVGFAYSGDRIAASQEEASVGDTDSIISNISIGDSIISWELKKGEEEWGTLPATGTNITHLYDDASQWTFRMSYCFDGDTMLSNEVVVQSKYDQTITFAPLQEVALTDADRVLGASANSDSAITFASSDDNVATIIEGKLHPVSLGTCIITASVAENERYWAAEDKTQEIVIKSLNQIITFEALGASNVGDADLDPGATTSSTLTINYSSSDSSIATIIDNKIRFVAEGTCIIYAVQAGDETYTAAQVSQTLSVLYPAPSIVNVFPNNSSLLYNNIEYTASAVVKTVDTGGIDSVIVITGASPEMMDNRIAMTAEADTFSTSLFINSAGTYYGQVIAFGVNGAITYGDTIEINCLSSAPVIVKSYPSQDTLQTIGDAVFVGVRATVPVGEIDAAKIYFSDNAVTAYSESYLAKQSDGLYALSTYLEGWAHFYISYSIIANGDTTFTEYILFESKCNEVDTITAQEADEIEMTTFKAHWKGADDAKEYLLDVWALVDGDTAYIYEDFEVVDTFCVINNLEQNTNYYYNVRVKTTPGCESDYSNTVLVHTAVATSLNGIEILSWVTTKPNLINIKTSINTKVKIYHISGVQIVSDVVESNMSFDVKSGIYFVELNNKVHKVVVP